MKYYVIDYLDQGSDFLNGLNYNPYVNKLTIHYGAGLIAGGWRVKPQINQTLNTKAVYLALYHYIGTPNLKTAIGLGKFLGRLPESSFNVDILSKISGLPFHDILIKRWAKGGRIIMMSYHAIPEHLRLYCIKRMKCTFIDLSQYEMCGILRGKYAKAFKRRFLDYSLERLPITTKHTCDVILELIKEIRIQFNEVMYRIVDIVEHSLNETTKPIYLEHLKNLLEKKMERY